MGYELVVVSEVLFVIELAHAVLLCHVKLLHIVFD